MSNQIVSSAHGYKIGPFRGQGETRMHEILWKTLHRQFFWSVCFIAMTSLFCGCGPSGPEYWPVSGKVTFQGKPVSAASIRFSNPKGGVDMYVDLDAESKYVVIGEKKGLPEGTYQVAIIPKLNYDNVKTGPDGQVIPSTMPSQNRPDIPTKYQEPATSGLTMTVKPESNAFDVDMQ